MKVIRNLSLKLSPGRVTAVVGDSGAGKSTLTHLLLRLYDPSQGGIFVDDFNLKELDLPTYHRFRISFLQTLQPRPRPQVYCRGQPEPFALQHLNRGKHRLRSAREGSF